MKTDLAKTIRDYFEGYAGPLDLEDLISDRAVASITTKETRGRSIHIPNGSGLYGMKIGVNEMNKLHHDLCEGLVSKNTCLFVIDILTLNEDLLLQEEGFDVLESLGSISSSEDLENWMRSSNRQR